MRLSVLFLITLFFTTFSSPALSETVLPFHFIKNESTMSLTVRFYSEDKNIGYLGPGECGFISTQEDKAKGAIYVSWNNIIENKKGEQVVYLTDHNIHRVFDVASAPDKTLYVAERVELLENNILIHIESKYSRYLTSIESVANSPSSWGCESYAFGANS